MDELDWSTDRPAIRAPVTVALPYDFRVVRAGTFMEHPASFYTIAPRRVLLGYTDSTGAVSTRQVTAMEVISCRYQLYIGGHCHLREESRTFRLDRIAFMLRAGTVEQVLPQTEVLRWLLER